MSDAGLRRLERRWEETRAREDYERYYAAAARRGRVFVHRLLPPEVYFAKRLCPDVPPVAELYRSFLANWEHASEDPAVMALELHRVLCSENDAEFLATYDDRLTIHERVDDSLMRRQEKVMAIANLLLGGFGVEAIWAPGETEIAATYVNMGDTYDDTIVQAIGVYHTTSYHLTSWGDFYEGLREEAEPLCNYCGAVVDPGDTTCYACGEDPFVEEY